MNQEIELAQSGNGVEPIPVPIGHYPTENYQIGDYSLVDIYRGDWVSNQIFRPFHDRCLEFVTRYNYETDVQWLSNGLVQAFHQSNPYWKMLVALDRSGKIRAHVIAYTEKYQALGNVAFILQLEKDSGVNMPGVFKAGMVLFDEWVRRLRLPDMLVVTNDEAHARLFKKWGFKSFRVILRRRIIYDPRN